MKPPCHFRLGVAATQSNAILGDRSLRATDAPKINLKPARPAADAGIHPAQPGQYSVVGTAALTRATCSAGPGARPACLTTLSCWGWGWVSLACAVASQALVNQWACSPRGHCCLRGKKFAFCSSACERNLMGKTDVMLWLRMQSLETGCKLRFVNGFTAAQHFQKEVPRRPFR